MAPRGKTKQIVEKVAFAGEHLVNSAGDAIGVATEIVGTWINDTLTWVGNKIGIKPVFFWLGGLFKEVFSIGGAIIKGTFCMVAGTITAAIKIIGGIFTWQGKLILQGFWDIFSPIMGTIIVVLGKLISLVQTIFYLQEFERPLTINEKTELNWIFKDSLNYFVIRIIEGRAGLFGVNSRSFTLGNTIYLKRDGFTFDLLVHESTHAWQYQQTGDRYASDALTAQWFSSDAYNWQREINVLNKDLWLDFNNEAQAEFIQDLWRYGRLRDGSGMTIRIGNGCFFEADWNKQFGYFEFNGSNYTSVANNAVKIIRNEWF